MSLPVQDAVKEHSDHTVNNSDSTQDGSPFSLSPSDPQDSPPSYPIHHIPIGSVAAVLLRLRKRLGYLFGAYDHGVLRIGPKSILKHHRMLQPSEAYAMQFIASKTSIPVPRVLDLFVADGITHLIMEYISGDCLEKVWHKMSFSQQTDIMAQLKGYVEQMRSLEHPRPGKVEAVHDQGCFDIRFDDKPFGPYNTVEEFQRFLGHGNAGFEAKYLQFSDTLERCNRRKYKTVFTHGDLAPRNIIVKRGKIVGILDWECSGWYPEYWEYTRTAFSNKYHPRFWELFSKTMEPYEDELFVEGLFSYYFVRL